jgi:hypothetical protein
MLPVMHAIHIVLLGFIALITFDGSTNFAALLYAVLRSLLINTSCLLGPSMQSFIRLSDSFNAYSYFFHFCHPVVLDIISKEINCHQYD